MEKLIWLQSLAQDPEIKSSAVRVGVELANCLNGQTGLCNPSQERLASSLGLSRRGVQMAISELVVSGYLAFKERGNGRANRAAYKLLKGAKNSTPKGRNNCTLSKSKRAQKTTIKGAKNDNPPTPPYKDESVKESVNSCRSAKNIAPATPKKSQLSKPAKPAPTAATWFEYADAYRQRYGVDPVRNQVVNSQLAAFVKRIGQEEAPGVAAYYVSSNASYYVAKGHGTGPLLADAEKLRTEWAIGRQTTGTQAAQADRAQSNANAAQDALDILQRKRRGQGHG